MKTASETRDHTEPRVTAGQIRLRAPPRSTIVGSLSEARVEQILAGLRFQQASFF